jgi:hypothetical protein
MITNYLNQSLSWKHVASLDSYNQPAYTTTTIKGRKESCSKLVNNSQGQSTGSANMMSNSLVFTESAISVNDKIDDKLVLMVETVIGLTGTVSHYEVYLE